MWHLMSRSVDTCLLITHWEFPSFHLGRWHDWSCWLIILIEDFDIVIPFVLHWYICLRYLTCYLWWLICFDWRFRYDYFLCASLSYLFEILKCWLNRLFILFRLAKWFRSLPWLFWSPCMYGFIVIYHRLIWHIDSLACILSWLSLSMMFVSSFILIVIAFAWAWMIYHVLCLTACRMTTPLLHDCMPPVYVGRISIPLPPTLLVSVILFIPVLTIASVRPSMRLLSDRARD